MEFFLAQRVNASRRACAAAVGCSDCRPTVSSRSRSTSLSPAISGSRRFVLSWSRLPACRCASHRILCNTGPVQYSERPVRIAAERSNYVYTSYRNRAAGKRCASWSFSTAQSGVSGDECTPKTTTSWVVSVQSLRTFPRTTTSAIRAAPVSHSLSDSFSMEAWLRD